MILLDVYIPSLDQSFDFEVELDISVDSVTRLIVCFLSENLGYVFTEREKKLFSYRKKVFLINKLTLREEGIRNADRLFLI